VLLDFAPLALIQFAIDVGVESLRAFLAIEHGLACPYALSPRHNPPPARIYVTYRARRVQALALAP
jgi:hypothetical protein